MGYVFNVYIDESGDEGFKANNGIWISSKWFVMGALIVRDINDLALSRTIDHIKTDIFKFSLSDIGKPLHFQKLKHHQRRAVLNEIIAAQKFRIVIVAVDKTDLNKTDFLQSKQALYNYTTRLLLERVSWLVGDLNGVCNLVFEHRRNTSYEQIDLYLKGLLTQPRCQIRPNVIIDWKSAPKWQFKNLQIADAVTSSFYFGLEPDRYGYIEDAYVKNLFPFLYRRKDKLFGYGLKFFPASGENELLQSRYPWLKVLKG